MSSNDKSLALTATVLLILAIVIYYFSPSPMDKGTTNVVDLSVSVATTTQPEPAAKEIDMMVVPAGTLVQLINKERTAPLMESSVLDVRARIRAEIICGIPFDESAHDSFYTAHDASILSDLSNATAENLGRNFSGDLEATHSAFMDSPTHKENILNPIYHYAGTATVTCQQNAYGNQEITVEFFTGNVLESK